MCRCSYFIMNYNCIILIHDMDTIITTTNKTLIHTYNIDYRISEYT